MRGVIVLAAILGLVSSVSAWDTLEICNSQYNTLVTNYNSLNSNYNTLNNNFNNYKNSVENNQSYYLNMYNNLLGNYSRLQDNLTECKNTYNARVFDYTNLTNEVDKCRIMLDAEQRISREKDATITQITSDRDSAKSDNQKCLTDRQTDSTNFATERNTCNEKIKVLADEGLTLKQGLGECDRAVQSCNYNLNVTQAKVVGTCNEYLASNYYKQWIQLSSDEKKCLTEVLKRDRVAFLTMDSKESIMIFCNLNWNYAVRYLQHFSELGFIEKDTTIIQFQIDQSLASDAKQYLSLAGYFRPVDLSRGCTQRFNDLDKYYQDGKNWGIELALLWTFIFMALFIVGATVLRRWRNSY